MTHAEAWAKVEAEYAEDPEGFKALWRAKYPNEAAAIRAVGAAAGLLLEPHAEQIAQIKVRSFFGGGEAI